MVMESDSISKLAISSLELKLQNSSANVNESLIVYLLVVRGTGNGTKIFASFSVDLPMADEIGRKDGRPPVRVLRTLLKPNIIPGLQPKMLKSLYCLLEISFLSLCFCLSSYSIFRTDRMI